MSAGDIENSHIFLEDSQQQGFSEEKEMERLIKLGYGKFHQCIFSEQS